MVQLNLEPEKAKEVSKNICFILGSMMMLETAGIKNKTTIDLFKEFQNELDGIVDTDANNQIVYEYLENNLVESINRVRGIIKEAVDNGIQANR